MKNPRRLMCLGLTSCLLVLTSVGLNRWSAISGANDFSSSAYVVPYTAVELAIIEAEEAENVRILAGGEHYKPLKMFVDYPGVSDPVMVQATDADLPESTEVIGIEVDGQHFSFVLSSMLNPKHHIVNLVLNKKPVSVTYCDLVDCVRVLTDETKEAIPLRVGGLDIDNQMVFLLDKVRYGQSSSGVPLQDYAFDRMTLGAWKYLHPATIVYAGPRYSEFDSQPSG